MNKIGQEFTTLDYYCLLKRICENLNEKITYKEFTNILISLEPINYPSYLK
jgi:hypothetical protein